MTNKDKKFRYPIEMDKEYALKVGIDPNELTYIMLDGKRTSVYFVELEDEQLYRKLIHPIWNDNKLHQRSERCIVRNKNGIPVRCNKDCAACSHVKSGTPISLDVMEETGGFRNTQDGVHKQQDSMIYASNTADIVEDAMLLKALWEHIGTLSHDDRIIVKMFSEGASEREIAAVIGMSQKGVNKRKKAIFEVLKNNLKDFF